MEYSIRALVTVKMKKKPILLYICLLQCLLTQVLGQDGDRQEVVGGILSSELEVVDNGYRHLNVIISSKIQQEEVCEDEEKRLNCKRTFKFIEKVKDFIKLLSKSIYEASRGHFYIESCNIIMPKSWDAPPANETEALNFGGTISYIDFDAIPIRIYPDMQNKLTGEKLVRRPYAVKATPCGYQGSYLRMSQAFIEDPQSLNFTAYGNPEKILAGEWAKFRWGVFDETPPPNKGHEFYLASNSRIEASRCSLKVEGDLILKEDTEDGRIKGDECMRMEAFQSRNLCEFVPKKQQKQSGLGSLLFSRHLDDVTEYCDNDPEKKLTFHNRDAKTRHNEVCDTKSIWEVIRAHDDYIKGAKGKPVSDFDSVNKGLWMNTKFTVMRQNNTKTVLTIDTSTSMGVGKRWENVKKAASQYLSALPHDAHVGIVFFARRAYQRTRGLIQIENGDSSELLRRRLESVPLNLGTSIGHALQEAMKMLKTSGPMDSRDSGGSIILLSDGAESNAPFIDEDLIQELIDNRVTVNTIAFGKDASPKLEEVSKRTKGSSYFSDPENPSSILQDAFIAELQKDGSNAHPIVSVKRAINAGSTEEFDFKIDQTIGKDTKITISYETNAEKDNRPEIKINTPGYPRPIIADMQNKVSESINPETGDPAYTVAWRENLEDGLITVDLTGKADNGTYTIYVKNDHSSPASVHINVVSYAREPDREPVTLTPTIIQKKIAPSNTDIVVIYAAFAQGEFPILFADLWAEVTFPLERNGTIMTTETVILTDDGKHDDVIANDGIYTGIFTNIFETGRYSIKVRANGDNGKAVVSKGHMLGIGELDDAEYEVVENAVHKEVWQTTRRRKRRNVRTTRDRRQSDGEEDYEYDDGEEEEEEEPPKRVEIPVISLKEPATNQDRVELNKQLEAQKLARLTRVSAQDTERVTNLDTIVIEASETDLCDEGFFHFDGFCYFISRDVQEQKNFKEAEDACAEMGAELIDIRTLQVAQYFLVTLRARIKDFWASDVNDKIVNHIPLLIDNIYSVTEVQAILDGLLGRVAKEFYLRKKDQKNSFARMASIRQHRDPDFDRDIKRLYEDLTKNIQVPMTYLQRRVFEKHKKTVDELSQEEIEEIKDEWKGKQLQKLDHFKEQLIDREKFELRSPRFLASFERAKREIDSLQFGPCRYKDIFHRYRKNRKFAICHSEKPVICQLISPKNAHNRNCPGNWTDFEGHFDSSDICYHFNETKRNFFEAEKYCQERGGTLLRINCANKEVFEIKEEKIDTFWISNMDTSGLNDLQCSKMSEEIIRRAESLIPEPEEPTASGMQMDVFVNKPVFTFGKTGANSFARSEVVEEEEGASSTTTSATTTAATITTSTTSTVASSSTTISDPSDSEENDPVEGEEIDDGVYDDDDEEDDEADDEDDDAEYNSYEVYEEMINQNPTEVPIVDVEGETYCMWFDGQLREVTNDFLCKNLKKNYICQKPKNDLLAPARIKDLDVQHFTSGSEKDPLGSFHIGFTATGNDDSQGRADRYEVRMVATEKGKEALRDDFDKGYHLQYSDFSNEITSRPDSPQKVGYYERLTIRFEHLAGCPRNQLMDLLVLVDTTQGNQTAGIELYLPAHALKILTYIGNVYNIGPWAAHVGFGTWDGREIRTEIYPDEVGTKHKQSYEETKQEMNETISKFYPKSDNKFDQNLKSFAPSNIPSQQRKSLKFDDVLGWKDDLAEKGHLRDEVKTVVLLITTRGEQCCSPLSLAEKARIPELEFVSLAIGNQPPKNWQEAFKFIPETDEERLDRLLGTKTSSTTETIVDTTATESESPEIAARKRRRRSSEIVEQENERTKRAGQIYARRNALDYKEDEKVDFFYQMEDLNTTYHHRMSKVTQLICHAKETETRYFSIRACDKAGNCGIPSPLAPVRVTLYYDSSLRNMPELPQKNELTGGDKNKQQQTGGGAVIGASLGAIGIILVALVVVAFLFGSRKKKNQGKSKGASKAGSRHGSAGRKASTGKDNSDRRSIRSGKSTGNSVSAVKAKQRLASRSGAAGAQTKGRKQSIASNTSSNKSGVRRGPKASTVKLKAKKRNQSTLNK